MGKLNTTQEFLKRLTTVDGWQSLVTNMGVRGKDKAESIDYKVRAHLSFAQIDAIYRQDGMGAKIVDEIVEDAFRCGWKITFPTISGSKSTAADVVEFNSDLEEWHKETHFKKRASDHFKQARSTGGALLVLGVKDGQEPVAPLNTNTVSDFNWMRSLDRFQVSSSGVLDRKPSSPNYGMPLWYHLFSVVSDSGGTTGVSPRGVGQPLTTSAVEKKIEDEEDEMSLNNVLIHNTRVWRTDGTVLSDRVRLQNLGWGESVLERAFEPLRHWSSAMKSSGTIMTDFTQGVYSIKGLSEMLSSDKAHLALKRFTIMDQVRSVVNAILVDADAGETFERKTTSVAGLPELIDRAMLWLSAISGMPMTKLFGVSPGGFGTGEAEGENWDNKTKAYQQDVMLPMLEYVYGILFQTPRFANVPEGWKIEFEPLQLESPTITAEIRSKNAQADSIYMSSGAVSSTEIAISRFGGSKYGTDISIDAQSRAEKKEVVSGGDQMTLKDLILMVSEGTVSADLAVKAAEFSIPEMSGDMARGIFDLAEKSFAAKTLAAQDRPAA